MKKKYDPWDLVYDSTKDHVHSDPYPDAWTIPTAEEYDRAILVAENILAAYQDKGHGFQIQRTERIIFDLQDRRDRLHGRPD